MSPRVSVLLTSYEAGDFIDQAIASVLTQTFTDFELLILDDGSEDLRVMEAISAACRDRRVRASLSYPSLEERAATVRYATLLNWGAAHTTGEYLTFLCGDDYYLPDRLDRMVRTLDGDERLDEPCRRRDVVYGAQWMEWEDGRPRGLRSTAVEPLVDAHHRVDLNSVMVTRAAFNAAGGFPDTPPTAKMWREADAHLWRRLTTAGFRFFPVPDGPTDVKRYRAGGVDERVKAGLTPWV